MIKAVLEKVYEPHKVESKWYRYWEKNGYFQAKIELEKTPFTIVIPPPNVTGSLHMGHALNNTLQDIIVRQRRMAGYPTLWLPGTDHAGIATQNVVEQQLEAEGLTREKIGRADFLKRTWAWKEKYGNRIIHQLKRLGCSCDWSRERFTLDEKYSKAVRTVFVRLYQEGLIYRDYYIVNWCPRCGTALADIEVEYQETEDKLYYVRYPFKDSAEYIVVATTRPETILGDTAVAVNPDDSRYQEYVGKTVLVPIIKREVPIIADPYVDPEFGTGALKVTPAHDPNDFEIGQRHNLERVIVMKPDGVMNKNAGPYNGLSRYECRKAILKDLKENGLLEKTEPYTHSVGICYRCSTVIEPYLSRQWFIKMKPLAEPAIKAVQEDQVKFTPKQWTKVYFDWMYNIKDWCISRQIWWGHQIPAWYCQDCGELSVAMEKPKSCSKCQSKKLEQDTDVLDTWFSSALWPFATLGWPEKTEDLAYFYPTSLLVTGHDIIYFWVARMIMMGLHFIGKIPFYEVYINALIRDVYGRKMSKSRGNVIDPLDIIERYGTDALRFTLAALATPGRDVFLSEERIEGYRNFANKIWNAARFVLMNLDDFKFIELKAEDLTLADRWIISKLNKVTQQVNQALTRYNFSEASRLLYDFFWSDFCDWHIELSKIRLYHPQTRRERLVAQNLLVIVLNQALKLLHPFMPFVTEEIWQRLPGNTGSIMVASWPVAEVDKIDTKAEEEMELIQAVTSSIRSIKAELRIPLTKPVEVLIQANERNKCHLLKKNASYIRNLAWVRKMSIQEKIAKPKHTAIGIEAGIEIYLPLEGLVDIKKEKERLSKELQAILVDLEKVKKKLANPEFIKKAPPPIVEKEQGKLNEYSEKKAKLELQLQSL